MKILGIDNGYSFTKDSDGYIFKSSFSNNQMLKSGTKITIDGKDYFVGSGTTTCDVNKIDSDLNMVTTLACMAKCKENDFKLVVGLPIAQYNDSKDHFRNQVLSYSQLNVDYNNKERNFKIHDVIVAPQGASIMYYSGIQNDCVIVDIGGLTIDVAQIDFDYGSMRITKNNTYYMGMRKLYSQVIELINSKYNLRLNNEDADKILRNGFTYKGEKKSLDILKPVLSGYIDVLYEELKLNYNTDMRPIVLVGGGAYILHKAMCKRFSNVILLSDSQFANANGYYHLGLKKWGGC